MRSTLFAGLFDGATAAAAGAIHVALPARVERYHADKQAVDVKPLIRRRQQNIDGSETLESRQVITNVPLAFPGGGGFRLTFPIAIGDTVLLVFADASLDNWLARGGEQDPLDKRQHALSDAIAIPGLQPFPTAWDNPGGLPGAASVGKDGGPQIHFRDGAIELNGPADPVAESVLRGTTYRANEAAMNTLLATAMTSLASALANIGTLIALGPVAASACAAVAASITTVLENPAVAPTYLSNVVKVK